LRYVFEASMLPPSGLSISSFAVWPSTGQLRSLTYFVPSGLGGGGITGPPPGINSADRLEYLRWTKKGIPARPRLLPL
jgi:hypothetical protein